MLRRGFLKMAIAAPVLGAGIVALATEAKTVEVPKATEFEITRDVLRMTDI